jgi:glycerol-3-phosphate dehydrogenase
VSRIAIIGSGAWGTALAISLARRGDHSIALWSHTATVAENIAQYRENRTYLPKSLSVSCLRPMFMRSTRPSPGIWLRVR